ncbi:MAG: glycosyltransferase family 39 protein [Anaerolineae bacterium]|nr:glycosyltransferase family 39 protein [Anaerolineae bacterium]
MSRRLVHSGLLIAALLVLMALGGRGLDRDLLWLDEYFSVGNVGGILRVPYNPVEVWTSVSQYSPQHPPAYFMLLSGWVALTGWTPFAMRSLSLFIALLLVALTYRVGREWLSPRAGLYAALVLSVSALLVHFAHELRMYTLMALLAIFTLWVYRRVITPDRQPRRWEWAGLFLGALGLIWVHYVSLIVVAAIGVYHLLLAPKNRRWWIVSVLLGLACLSFLPWIQILMVGARFIHVEEDTGVPVMGPAGAIRWLFYLFGNGNLGLAVVLMAASLLALRQRGARDLWVFTAAALVLTLVANAITPMINENRPRYLLPLWPLLALLVGLGLTVLERRRWQIPALLLLAAWLWIGVSRTLDPQFLADLDGPRYTDVMPPLREIIADANHLGEPDDLILGFSREQYLFNEVKFGPIAEFYLRDLRMANAFITLPDPRPPEQIHAAIREIVGTRLAVWFASEPIIAPETLTVYREALDAAGYMHCDGGSRQPGLRLERYELAAFGCLSDAAPDTLKAHFDSGLVLNDLKLAVDEGDLLAAAGWTVADSVPPEQYSVSLKLWNASGDFVAQADYGLRAAGFGWQLGKIPVSALPPSDYRLTVTVYDWRTGATLTGHTENESGELVTMQIVTLPLDA